MEKENVLSDFRVGIVTFISFVFLVVGITFAGGDKGLLFQKTMLVKARINDINGLKKGSAVTMGGMAIGKVTDISFLKNGGKHSIEVTMQVRAEVRERIRSDSQPSIRTQGMLGDRYIEIAMGSPEAAPYEEGTPLLGSPTSNFDDTLQQARTTLAETTKMLEAINQQQGTLGQFFYDQTFYQKLMEITTELNEVIKDFKQHPRKYIKLSVF